jgi:hypothetical protein
VLVSYLSARGAFFASALTLAVIFTGVAFLERAPYERQPSKVSRTA